jgi:periplasmic protein CpxP/Spy
MKKSIFKHAAGLLTFAALILFTSVVSAQQGPREGRGNWSEQELADLKKELSLSADQEKKVKAIIAERQKETDARRAQAGNQDGNREQRMQQAREQRETYSNKIKEVLNDEQKKKFDAWQEKRQQEMRRGQGQGPQGGNR